MLGLHRLHGLDVRAIVVHFTSVSLLFCVASLFLFDRPVGTAEALDGKVLLMLLGVGVFATVGQLLLTHAFAAGLPTKVSVVGLTQVVFALALDLLVWERSFNPATLLGMGLVVAPTAWVMVYRG
jgi:drug/metabolite transporter (DMT)-like permease